MVPKVAAIHDLSGFGKCSLTAALPILAAMGVQACPLPTAILSGQTGFPAYTIDDYTRGMEKIMGQWRADGRHFAGIYTGFLGNVDQLDSVAQFIEPFRKEGAKVLVDPVMGDGGEIYPIYTGEMCAAMYRLVEKAHIVTPNLTEACLLTGESYAAVRGKGLDGARALAKGISAMGPRTVIVTGVHADIQGEDTLFNIGYEREESRFFETHCPCIGDKGYSGTGDILASILCGAMVTGIDAEIALGQATTLLALAIEETHLEQVDPNEGVAFEHYLHLLRNEGTKPCKR